MKRGIDHLVLSVADLEAARHRYQSFGFTTTPRAEHPFGTANSLVQLGGNFLELICVDAPHKIPPMTPGHFSFGAFNMAYAARRQGMSMLVLESDDARRDRAEFLEKGLQTYAPFDFSRQATLPHGSQVTVSFSLAFVTEERMPEAAFFVCQQRAPEYFWNPEYQRHANGATEVVEVVMVADDPDSFDDFFTRLEGEGSVSATGGALAVSTSRGQISMLTPELFAARFPDCVAAEAPTRRRRSAWLSNFRRCPRGTSLDAKRGDDMTTLLYSHPACAEHDPGSTHPESPARLAAVLDALAAPEFAALGRREAPPAAREQLTRVHPETYVDAVFEAIPETGHASLDADTTVSPGSGEAARRAAGALCAAVDAVAAGEADNAFCAVRPPGHHAEPTRPMGFCMFNNVAVGALQARAAHGYQRVAVVDFDVHHGNGTQAMFWDDPDLMFASTHQMPLYPGTGAAEERGGHGNIVNMPLAPASGSGEFRAALHDSILPALRSFGPEFLLVSAGFDAHADDPLAGLRFHEDDYAWATAELLAVALESCGGRLVSTLEGGYDLAALAASAAAHVRALMAAP